VPRYDACLLDVFETVLSVDQVRHLDLLARRAGLPPDELNQVAETWAARVTDGRASLAEAFAAELGSLGAADDERTVADLVEADRELMTGLTVLHPDTVPFLESLRAAGVRTAFVSNCNENARPLLDALGLTALVDDLVLSCEVGVAKPDPKIFRIALDRLGVTAEATLFVDDLQDYCDAAGELGMTSVRIDRHDGTGEVDTLAALTGRVTGPA
jgi:putative hydrolase of the HAD superfamily